VINDRWLVIRDEYEKLTTEGELGRRWVEKARVLFGSCFGYLCFFLLSGRRSKVRAVFLKSERATMEPRGHVCGVGVVARTGRRRAR